MLDGKLVNVRENYTPWHDSPWGFEGNCQCKKVIVMITWSEVCNDKYQQRMHTCMYTTLNERVGGKQLLVVILDTLRRTFTFKIDFIK